MFSYTDILASIVHDVKNSLSMVSSHVEEIINDDSLTEQQRENATNVQQEALRANNQLIQVLALYKLDNKRLSPNIMENNLYDFLEELQIEENGYARAQQIRVEIDCDEWLSGYFDPDLVRGVISSSIGNAKRYTKDEVLVSAQEQDGYLVIRVEDNGNGFPERFLHEYDADGETFGKDFSEGRTQLGFFFASNIAALHKNRDKSGFIRLSNGHSLPGGCFELWLP